MNIAKMNIVRVILYLAVFNLLFLASELVFNIASTAF
jgi:hypothetical protein